MPSLPATNLISGTSVSKQIRSELRERVGAMVAKHGEVARPGLAVILVGDRADSASYVRAKRRACEEIGIKDVASDYPGDVTQEALLDHIAKLNKDDSVHGILVQLPLPKHIDEQVIINAITPAKDVDGLHPINLAALSTTTTHGGARLPWRDMNSIPFPISCTPQGCVELLDRTQVRVSGKKAVVIGRSNIVGIPLAMLLMQRNATVTIVHSRTVDAPSIVREADLVFAAVGVAEMVTRDWIKPGATVIDVGINAKPDDTVSKGYKLVGDVDFNDVKDSAHHITPVPGGVGPMTIAMLMRNVVNATRRSLP